MKKSRHTPGFILILILLLQVFGCTDNQSGNGKIPSSQPETEHLEENTNIPIYGRSDNIILDADIDFQALGIEYFDDAVSLFQDEELNDKVYCDYKWDKEQHSLSLLPPERPVLNISTNFASKSLQKKYEHSDYYFFDKGESKDWGNLGIMYLAKWIDLKTGEKLKQPEITKIQIKGELDTPENFQFTVSEHGNAMFSWNAVENAETYLIVRAVYRTDELRGFFENCDVFAETTDTNWQSHADNNHMNTEFRTSGLKLYENSQYYYGVIAIGTEGTSMISSVILEDEMTKRLPYCKLENGNNGESSSVRYASRIELLSRYQWIELCDESMAQRLISYQTDQAEITNITLLGRKPKDALRIPYTIEGTDFDGSFYVENFNPDTYPEDLKILQERQNILKSKMTGMLTDVKITVKPNAAKKDTTDNEKNKPQISDNTAETVIMTPTATTELSECLATSLLQGEENILISGMSENLDEDTFMDAFYEAYFQNPLIPAIKEVSVSESLDELSVIYEEDKKVRKEKQQKVIEQVNFVAGELLEEDMSDTDKVLAINSYLCDSISYDDKAAEQSLTKTGTFTDSATVYGALVSHKGVCTAYAGTFQLLAKAMGLESIVVTGTLSGSQNHMWNKVKIDGNWYVVDVTSNDGLDMKNVILNVSDDVAGLLITEDERYLCDENTGNYAADSDANEYFHLTNQYYEKDEIAKALIKELTYNSKATLRTDATINNAEFQTIVQEVMGSLENAKLQGYFQLGVIYLER